MTKPEVLWCHEKGRNLLLDLQTFCRSLDHYEILLDLTQEGGKRVYLNSDNYELDYLLKENAFLCPECGHTQFDVVEGEASGKPILGLACLACNTYGIVFPRQL